MKTYAFTKDTNLASEEAIARNDRNALYSVALFLAPVMTLLVGALLNGGLGKALSSIYGSSDMLQRPVE